MSTVTLSDIAKRAKTSKTTVSRVLNYKPGSVVSDEKREDILRIANDLGYLPSRRARLFATRRNDSVALVITEHIFTCFRSRPTTSLLLEVIAGASEELSKAAFTCPLINLPLTTVEPLPSEAVDAFFFLNFSDIDQVLALHAEGVPTLSYYPSPDHPELPALHYAQEPALMAAAKHLAALGHRDIGCIYGTNSPRIAMRRDLFLAHCRLGGINVRDEAVIAVEDETGAYLATRELIAAGKLPRLLFYTADHHAMLGMQAIREAGLRVPQDVSVLGYDGAGYAIHAPVSLSTICIPRRQAGAAAARHLMNAIEQTPVTCGLTIPCHFQPADSIGPCPGATP